jgi:hypothetical protein
MGCSVAATARSRSEIVADVPSLSTAGTRPPAFVAVVADVGDDAGSPDE